MFQQALYRKTIATNAKAAALIHDGSYQEASSLLQQALFGLRDAMNESAQQEEESDAAMYQEDEHHTLRLGPVPINASIASFEGSFSPHNEFELFGKAFLIGADNESDIESSMEFPMQLTAALLFNSGIASHCMSITTGRSDYLKRGFAFYKQAYHLLTHRDIDFNDSSIVLLLALYNNMGHCLSHQMDATGAIQDLRSAMEHILKKLDRSNDWSEEYVVFDLSQLSTISPRAAPAA